MSTECYKVNIYTEIGYFTYEVPTMTQAIEHAHLIMSRGVYRRVNSRGELEFHRVIKTKVIGDNLRSEYNDEFKRT